jgi:Skp family chaperone for outer membrane proteins|tara:strand:+ start:933 stop:1511 length:579 start_codon:yes stop_codon:yes gene_type:complete
MSEEQVNTPQAEENSETNPSTQADKNDVPYTRFQEVNVQKNQFKSENESLKAENAKLKAAEEDARQQTLKKNSEFETLYNETDALNKKQAEQIKAYEAKELEESERLDAKIPEDQHVFTKGMTNAVKAQYIEQLQSNVNAGKTDSSRAGTTAKGEFGGYSSHAEWASKDPEGYKQSNMTPDSQGIKIGYGGV